MSSLKANLAAAARLAKLNRAERAVFTTALFSIVVVRAALIVVPVRRLIALSNTLGRRWPIRQSTTVKVARAAKRIAQAKRYFPWSTCLSDAIAACFVMSRLGYDTEIRIGVAKSGEKFEAHAWLECPENIVIGAASPNGEEYVRMPSLRRFVA